MKNLKETLITLQKNDEESNTKLKDICRYFFNSVIYENKYKEIPADVIIFLATVLDIDFDTAKRLSEFGIDLNCLYKYKIAEDYFEWETPLMSALNQGASNFAQALIKLGVNIFEESISDGYTALFFTAYHDDVKTAKILIEMGSDVNKVSECGDTPLIMAAQCGAENLCDLLLEKGADITIPNCVDMTADLVAAESGHDKLAVHLRDILLKKMNESELAKKQAPFNEVLWKFLRKYHKNQQLAPIYKSCGISKQNFCKMKNAGKSYKPKKENALRIAIGLKLNLSETEELLFSAGYHFDESTSDSIIKEAIQNHEYDILAIDQKIEEAHGKLLGKY